MMSTAFGIHNSQIVLRYAYCIWRASRTTSTSLCSIVYTRAHPVHMENVWMLLRALVLDCNTYIVIYATATTYSCYISLAPVFCVDVEPCQTFFSPVFVFCARLYLDGRENGLSDNISNTQSHSLVYRSYGMLFFPVSHSECFE